ncbi:MAG: phytanoyl-CoA dioxygenase family protein [Abitibacteriaceae bacterium]|nr:phytanoyl-CoA dioxygenase family protein [Abditibacteriaceae bacterium]
MSNAEIKAAIERDGFAIVPDVVVLDTVNSLISAIEAVREGQGVQQRGTASKANVYAIRNLLEVVPTVRELAQSAPVRALLKPILGPNYFAVRGILFDKIPQANWKVTWHQDLSIAVRERKEAEGFGPWPQKAGVLHVQPPVAILEGMLTLRLHLDDCTPENGPLQVIPGSHHYGRLDAQAIQCCRKNHPAVICPVPRGGALLMKPLLLHASSASQTPHHRRVIHLEFAAKTLPDGLAWHC